jgi:tetratricopeptide (TPR) repeat protein
MIDIQLFGLNSGMHHLTNVFFHIANTILLFLIIRKMTGEIWKSAFVAALFALHPLHVQSVAWVSERKDVLSTFFWLLTMGAYLWYIKRPWYVEGSGVGRYLLVIFLFLMGLLAKPMLVTLPCVLLLIDYWPLNRVQERLSRGSNKKQKKSIVLALIYEKVPFFILAATFSVVALIAQIKGGTLSPLDALPIHLRFFNALVAYVVYLGKMIWPFNLSVFYPHPGKVPGWQVVEASLLLATLFFLAFKTIKQAPYFAVGWLWYIITLVPVIGLVQVGEQTLADRYTYVPLIGIFIVFAWGVPQLFSKLPNNRLWLVSITVAILSFFTTTTWLQIKYWKNSSTLFERALNVTSNNHVAHVLFGRAFEEQGKIARAIEHYSAALRVKPDYELGYRNMGRALAAQDRFNEAIEHYYEALRINPNSAGVHNDLGLTLATQGKIAEAIDHYSEAINLEPFFAEAHNNLGLVLIKMGKIDEAIVHFREALQIKSGFDDANINLKKALALKKTPK